MDPNETAQKLLLQDTFHEVKRKRDRRKEAQISNIPNNREPADFRWRPGPQGRGGGRGGRGNYPSRYVSRDVTGGRNANFGKENGINQVIDKSITPASASVVQDTENSMTTIPSSATGPANGPRKVGYPISTQECTLKVPAVSCTVSVEGSPAPMNKIGTPISNDVIGSASGLIVPTPDQILSTAHQSVSDPVLGTSQVTRNPVPVTIKPEVWCQQPAHDSTIKRVVSARDTTVKKVVSSVVSGSEGPPISGKGFSQMSRSVHGNLPSPFLDSEAKHPLDTSQSVSSSHQSNSVGSRPSSSYSSRSQQQGGPQRVTGQIKEWKPKSTNISPPQASESLVSCDARGEALSRSQPASSSTSSEDSTSKLQKKFHNMQFSEAQQVIIPDHLQVPESERTGLSFGSFDALFVPGARLVCDPDNDKSSTHLSESSQEVVENVEETCSSDQSRSPAVQEADYLGPHTPEPMPEDVSSREHDHSSTSPVPEYEPSKSEEALTQGGLPFPVVHAAPAFTNFGIVSPMLGSQFTTGEGAEPLSRDSSRLTNFVQPFDPSTFYAQIYRPSADGSLLPVATKYNGNTVAQPVQTGQSPQEIANSSVLSSTVSTTPVTQPAGVSQSSLTVSQQPVPVFRQPAGVHLTHFPPNFFPYSQYLSPFYVPPPTFHQFLSNTPYPQQPSAISMYPPPAVAPGAASAKYSISQYKPPSNSGNPNPLPAVYGAYSSSPSVYSSVTNGISTGSEDLTSSQYKESNVYINGQQQTEGSTMWIPATGREGSALQPGSFYNLPQGQQMNFTPTQAGHGAFTGIYHPSQSIPGGVHLLSQAIPGTVEMVAPPAGVYQQPQRAQINWSNNY